MVAQAVQQSPSAFRGLRPFNPARDLRGVALLLEQAFREDLGFLHAWSRVPVLREVGAFFWAASFAPGLSDSMLGFVWEEEGRLVGNVTLTLDDGRRGHWLISNVAVEEKFRRRGIARQMMEAAIAEARRRGASWLILNVRPHNAGAIRLYADLGFDTIDTEMGYARRRSSTSTAAPLPLRRLQVGEMRAAFELARTGMNDRLSRFRPLRSGEFGVHVEDRVAERVQDFFSGQSTERWGYFEGEALRAVVVLRAQRLASPHSFDLRPAPGLGSETAGGVLAFTLARLARFSRREVVTHALASHGPVVEALGQAGFVPTRGLTLMAKKMT